MKLWDLIYISFRFIRIRFMESLMVILGLALGVAIVSSLFSLVSAYNREMKEKTNTPHQREIRVESKGGEAPPPPEMATPVTKINNLSNSNQREQILFTINDIVKIKRECPAIAYGYVEYGVRFSVGDNFSLTTRGGVRIHDFECKMVSPEYFSANNLEVAFGSFFTESDIHEANPVIILGSTLAKKLFPQKKPQEVIGEKISLTSPDSGKSFDFTVIGILKHREETSGNAPPGGFPDVNPMGINASAFSPYTLSMQYRSKKSFDALTFSAVSTNQLKNAILQLKNYFQATYGRGAIQIHSALDWEKDQRKIIIPIFSIITFFVGAGLLMAAINILNLMLARIARRKKDIGISMAIGASRFDIFKLFLTESLSLGIFGGTLGCVIAFILSDLLQLLLNPNTSTGGGPQMEAIRGAGPQINITISVIVIALLLTLTINAIFGIYPAYRASKVEPTNVLRVN